MRKTPAFFVMKEVKENARLAFWNASRRSGLSRRPQRRTALPTAGLIFEVDTTTFPSARLSMPVMPVGGALRSVSTREFT
ncbi:hypothetical protein RA307_12325 [Xanthobacteraceae bacterium Astr-EGSB]|uniref:hypothetical protein n=1 Tax=Astrobacterium formosum TaxID=3069710 RepID=UPI0027B3AC1C|nr:hypothetical protein [Xanthobacteraceae bacterium Astr-EGSB]